MFLHLSVILFTGGCLALGPGGLPLGLGVYTPLVTHPLVLATPPVLDTHPWAHPSLYTHTPFWTHSPHLDTPHTHTSWRYASYWSAFLFGKVFTEKCMKMKEIGAPLLDPPMINSQELILMW